MSTLNDDEITTGGRAEFQSQGGEVAADADQDDADGTDDSDQSDDSDDADTDDASVGPADSTS